MPSADNRQRHHDPAKVKYLIRLRTRLVLDDDDLLTEILLRLPAKSLIRFKYVCKKWQSIISSDHFCHQHTLRFPKLQPSLILRLQCYSEYYYFNPITTNGDQKKLTPYNLSQVLVRGSQLLQAWNGLMLYQLGDSNGYITVYDPTTDRFIKYLRAGYCVYNLTTRRSRKIFLTHNHEYPHVVGIHLAFDPSKSPYYKIVCIRSTVSHKFTCYHIEVYDSESHTWKVSLEAFTSPTNLSSHATCWNNGLYWKSSDGSCCFDIVKNEMKMLSYPYSNVFCPPYLQESNGRLYCYRVKLEFVTVWELRENDDHRPQWLLRYDVYIRKCDGGNIVRLMMGRSDGNEDGDGDETCKILIHAGGKIWTYNFDDKTYKNPLDLKIQPCYRPKDRRFHVRNVFQFGETLALV